MGFLHRQATKVVLQVVARPKLTLVIAGLLLAASVGLAIARLSISTDQNKLFSTKVKFFRDYLQFVDKFPENEAIYVIIEAKNPRTMPPVQQWTALADQIACRLRQIPQHVKSVDYRVPLDRLGTQGILFDDPVRVRQTIADLQRFVPLVKLWAQKPDALTGLLGNSPMERFVTALAVANPDPETAAFVQLLANSWVQTLAHPDRPMRVGETLPDLASLDAADPSRLGYYFVPDETNRTRRLMLVRVYQQEDYTSLTGISQTVEAIRHACATAAQAFPEFTVGVTGRPALEADEMRTTDRDSHRAEIVALGVIFVALVTMLRSIRLALLAELTLAVAIGWTFGYATLAVGELNLLSIVFLIALIGIGMDYLIQILSAYQREVLRYTRPRAIWCRVFRFTGPPISTACAGAAGAFFVAVFTDFRGAADLGIIAGGGLLLCLLAGYTVLPALLVLFPPKAKPVDPATRYGVIQPSGGSGRWMLLLPVAWITALLIGIPFMARSRFNPNLLELQAPQLESVKLVQKLQTWSAVVLSTDLEKLRQARQALQGAATVAGTESILTALDNSAWFKEHKDQLPSIQWTTPTPLTSDDIRRLRTKTQALAERFAAAPGIPESVQAAVTLRELATALSADPGATPQKLAGRLSAWQEAFIPLLRDLLAQAEPPPLDLQKVPDELRNHLVSADGVYALYIYPKEDLWKSEGLSRFVAEVESRIAPIPNAPIVTGIAPNVFHSTSAVAKAFYRSTAYALGLIFLLVYLDLRHIGQTLITLSVLAFGLPMLVALMGLLDIQWNFANFFGLPILIGAGHEYGVFMIHRYREVLHHPRRVWRRWDANDHALLLCALVTSSSFAFFWALGHHEGLKSLGLVMALGSACIYLATLIVVRPLLLWRLGSADAGPIGATRQ